MVSSVIIQYPEMTQMANSAHLHLTPEHSLDVQVWSLEGQARWSLGTQVLLYFDLGFLSACSSLHSFHWLFYAAFFPNVVTPKIIWLITWVMSCFSCNPSFCCAKPQTSQVFPQRLIILGPVHIMVLPSIWRTLWEKLIMDISDRWLWLYRQWDTSPIGSYCIKNV